MSRRTQTKQNLLVIMTDGKPTVSCRDCNTKFYGPDRWQWAYGHVVRARHNVRIVRPLNG